MYFSTPTLSLLIITVYGITAQTKIKTSREFYLELPAELRKFIPLMTINTFKTLSASEKAAMTVIANKFKETRDKQEFLESTIQVSNALAKQVIFLQQFKSLSYAVETAQDGKDKVEEEANAAFNFAVACLSGDATYQEEAVAEAKALIA